MVDLIISRLAANQPLGHGCRTRTLLSLPVDTFLIFRLNLAILKEDSSLDNIGCKQKEFPNLFVMSNSLFPVIGSMKFESSQRETFTRTYKQKD